MLEDSSVRPHEDLLEPMLKAARPDLFRANAFRLLGISARATELEIKKQSDKARMMEKYGRRAMPVAGPLPLDPPPDSVALLEAAQHLRDPELRLIDEFFWFWPKSPEAGNDERPLAALACRDVESAVEVWNAQANHSGDGGLARHNLALLFHTLALDIENARHSDPLARELKTIQEEYWRKGLAQWQALLADESFWELLDARAVELNDPRVPEHFAQRLKATLPVTMLLITARLALAASARGADEEARQYERLMRDSGFSAGAVAEACARAVSQVRAQLQSLCETARAEASADAVRAVEATNRLLTQARPLLRGINILLPSGDSVREHASDEVAVAATDCLNTYREELPDWKVALELVEQAHSLGVSPAVRARAEDLRIFLLRRAYRSGG